jgi:hypothetical protein
VRLIWLGGAGNLPEGKFWEDNPMATEQTTNSQGQVVTINRDHATPEAIEMFDKVKAANDQAAK